jgi:transglutaminase-like putative cysteine protease
MSCLILQIAPLSLVKVRSGAVSLANFSQGANPMLIQIDVAMHYRFTCPNTVFLALEAANTDGQKIVHENLDLGESELHRIEGDAGVGERIWARVPGYELRLAYQATVDIIRPDRALEEFDAAPLHLIPGEVAPYLRPSRYCQSDKFVAFVEKRFGHLVGGRKVVEIRDWIEAELTYVPGSSDADTNVLETFAGRQGVCRDYAHLMCSMVRAAQIPSRMVAVYSPDVTPPDFHAVAQVWLGGQWHLVDSTGMTAADTMAVISVGRDAYDVAFMDSQADAELVSQSVLVKPA